MYILDVLLLKEFEVCINEAETTEYLNQVGRRSLINTIWMKTYGSSL
jgi:hypothetical protein